MRSARRAASLRIVRAPPPAEPADEDVRAPKTPPPAEPAGESADTREKKLKEIFYPMVTTKNDGMGLGLSIAHLVLVK